MAVIDPHTLPRSRLEREYILNALLATFIRAIRIGVLNPSHGAVVLAHYDRLGSGFDTNIKIVVDFLRDLGMFKAQGRVVASVIVQALEEVLTFPPYVSWSVNFANRLSCCSWMVMYMLKSTPSHWRGLWPRASSFAALSYRLSSV